MCAPGCASRPHEGGRAASEVDHHARRRPLVARSHGWNVRRARAERTEGTSRSDFSKGLLEATPPTDFRVLLPSQYPATASVTDRLAQNKVFNYESYRTISTFHRSQPSTRQTQGCVHLPGPVAWPTCCTQPPSPLPAANVCLDTLLSGFRCSALRPRRCSALRPRPTRPNPASARTGR